MEKVVNEIKSLFEDFQMSVSDLQTPNPLFIGYFLYKVLGEFEVDLDNVKKVQISQSECGPEEVEILQELNLVVAVRAAFPFLKFGLFDILNPGQKRTLDIIGKTLQFYRLCDDLIVKLETQIHEYLEAKDNIIDMLVERDERCQQLNELALQKDNVIQKFNDIKSKVREVSIQLNEIAEVINKKEEEKNSLTLVENKQDSLLAAVEHELEAINSEIESLKSEIVENPQIYELDLAMKEKEKLKIEEQKNDIWAKMKVKAQKKKHLEEVGGAVNSLLQHLEVFETFEQLRQNQDNFAFIQDELAKLTIKEEARVKDVNLLEIELENEERCIKEITAESETEENKLKKMIEENERLYAEELIKHKHSKKECGIANNELVSINKKIDRMTETLNTNKMAFIEVVKSLQDVATGKAILLGEKPSKPSF